MPPWLWVSFGTVLGTIVGSYLATLAIRWPQGRAARGRSLCDGCGRQLKPCELVPILSCTVARGRCRTCGATIDPRHLALELGAAAIGGVAAWIAPGVAGLAGALFGWIMLALAALDLEYHWLPDRLTVALAISGAVVGMVGLPPSLPGRLVGGAAGYLMLALVAIAYRRSRGRDGMGAGDAKLLGAVGLWLGWRALPFVLLAASLVGIVAVMGLHVAGRRVTAATRVPFGTLLAAAAWAMWIAMNVPSLRIAAAVG